MINCGTFKNIQALENQTGIRRSQGTITPYLKLGDKTFNLETVESMDKAREIVKELRESLNKLEVEIY